MSRVKIVYFGTPEFSSFVLEQLITHFKTLSDPKFEIQAIVTRSDKPVGREKVVKASDVAKVGEKYNIPVLKPEKLDQEFIDKNIKLLDSDLFLVVSFGKIIPQSLLDIPKLGSINLHGSILPELRGASPIQTAILNGEKTTGVTVMLMDDKMDHGDILKTEEVSLSEQYTYPTLSNKLKELGIKVLEEVLPDFVNNKLAPIPQDHSKATFTKIIKKSDGYFDVNNPPSPGVLDRMIRAYHPWPGVWTKWNEKIIKFFPDGLVQMEGKNKVPLKDFLNGYPSFPIKSI